MAYFLYKPYTETERVEFVFQYNHGLNMRIEDLVDKLVALEAWEEIVDGKVVDNSQEYQRQQFEQAKARKKNEALTKAYEYEKVGTFTYTAEEVKTGKQVEVNIEFKPDNLTKFQGYVLGYMTQTITGKVTWLSAEDIAIYCTEEDCKAILQLIAQKDSKLWEVDYVKYLRMVDECLTVEGVERIVIDYEALNKEEN